MPLLPTLAEISTPAEVSTNIALLPRITCTPTTALSFSVVWGSSRLSTSAPSKAAAQDEKSSENRCRPPPRPTVKKPSPQGSTSCKGAVRPGVFPSTCARSPVRYFHNTSCPPFADAPMSSAAYKSAGETKRTTATPRHSSCRSRMTLSSSPSCFFTQLAKSGSFARA